MSSKIRLVAGALLPRAAEVRALRARLLRAQESVAHWKLRFERRAADVDRLKAVVDGLKRRLVGIEQRADARKHGELSHAVLEQLLPLRAQERACLASDVTAGHERARRLMEAAPGYAAILQDAESRLARLERMQLAGLTWWLPKDEATTGRARDLQQQGFPVRAILQTREVALGGVMLDVGANIGRTSIPRVLLGDVRAVYAAEPEPINYACLVQNVVEHGLEGFVLPDRVAIGAARGEVSLRRSPHIGGHRVLKRAPRRRAQVETIPVQLWPLDQWMVHVGVDPRSVSFVKVDTQGFEVDVLLGAPDLLARRHVAWQIEIDPGLLKRAGASLDRLLALLQAHFTHFIDIGSRRPGSRSQPVGELAGALDYLGRQQAKTDVLLYCGAR
jgi:FkbM family methyltransferase